jgi:hypothetical protein
MKYTESPKLLRKWERSQSETPETLAKLGRTLTAEAEIWSQLSL